MSFKLIYHTPGSVGQVSPFDTAIKSMVNKKNLRIACPYLGLDYLKSMICDAASWFLITDVKEWVGSCAFSNRKNIVDFINKNTDSIHHCINLHAKILVSESHALIGSANFTEKGITSRDEMSVLIDNEEHVTELWNWFELLWSKTDSVSVNVLNDIAEKLPEKQDASAKVVIPSKYSGIKSKYVLPPTLPKNAMPVTEYGDTTGALPKDVQMVLDALPHATQDYVKLLMKHVRYNDVPPWRTGTRGGDIRFGLRNNSDADRGNIYAELWFLKTKPLVWMRLYAPHSSFDDSDINWVKDQKGPQNKYDFQLSVDSPVPDKVIKWIRNSKEYVAHG